MPKPAISIIMNCLNGERYLPAAFASVRAQTFTDYEIIFWDNCSKDASADIAHDFGSELRYFRSSEPLGLGAARNMAIAQAKGEYIAFLDCDDIWRPSKLAVQIELFEKNPALGLVCTDTEVCHGQNVLYRMFDRSQPKRGNAFKELMLNQWVSMSSAMLRKSALDDIAKKRANVEAVAPNAWFDANLEVCEEADVFYRIAHDWEMDFINEPLTVWRIHNNNSTFRNFGKFADETLKIIDRHRKLYPGYDEENAEIIEMLQKRAAFQKSVYLWQSGNGAKARKTLAPYRHMHRKYGMFWWVSYLPGSLFEPLSKIYFALPAWLKNI